MCGRKPENLALYLLHRGDSACRACDADVLLRIQNTKERFGAAEDDNPPTLGHNIGLLFKNKPLLLLVLSGILGGARMVYTYTGGLYFCKYALQNESAYSLLTMLVVPGGLVASVLCPWLTNKFGKNGRSSART